MKQILFPPGSLVAAYFRDSGGETQELSISQQESFFRSWCTQNGLIPGAIFKDSARPGSTVAGRQAFHDMMHHFRTNAPEVGLVIWSYSRFARDFDDAQFYRADIRHRGYLFHSLNDDIPDGSMGRLFEAVIDWKNEQFLEDLSRDVRRGLNDLVRTHGAVPGTPPRGFMRVPVVIGTRRNGLQHIVHRWAPDPDQIDRIRQAFAMRASGASLSQINSDTKIFGSLNSYLTFFTNRLYIGILEFGDLVIENYCEPIIDRETWEAVQQRVQQHASHRNLSDPGSPMHPRRVGSHYLLSGLAYCGRCDSPLYGSTTPQRNGHIVDRYACTRAIRRRDCDFKPVPRKTLEGAVIDAITTYILQPDVQLANQRIIQEQRDQLHGDLHAKKTDLVNRLAGVRRRIANLTAAIAEAGHSSALLEQLARLEAEYTEMRSQLAALDRQLADPIPDTSLAQLTRTLDELRGMLSSSDIAVLQPLLRGMLSRIVVDREGPLVHGELIYYYPPSPLPQHPP